VKILNGMHWIGSCVSTSGNFSAMLTEDISSLFLTTAFYFSFCNRQFSV